MVGTFTRKSEVMPLHSRG